MILKHRVAWSFFLMANATFDNCPHLDVLVVGEVADAQLENSAFLGFLKSRVKSSRYVIGVSNGVVALAKAGVLKGRQVTADSRNLAVLKTLGAEPVNRRCTVVDGKFYTSGPATGGIESAFMVMRELRGDRPTKLIELTVEYNPRPQFPALGSQEPNTCDLQSLKPLKVAVLMPPLIYAPDAMGAIDVFSQIPSTEVFYVWKEKGKARSMLGPMLAADTTFEECPQVDVVIVGAVMPWVFYDQPVNDFMIRQEKGAQAMLSTCGGVFVYGGSGLLEGKRAASNFHMVDLLPCVGAIPSHKEIEVDGKFYTAGPAIGSYEAALMAVRKLYGDDVARHIEQDLLEYEPHPVFGVGSPELAGELLTFVSHACVVPFNPFVRVMAKKGYRRNALPIAPQPGRAAG